MGQGPGHTDIHHHCKANRRHCCSHQADTNQEQAEDLPSLQGQHVVPKPVKVSVSRAHPALSPPPTLLRGSRKWSKWRETCSGDRRWAGLLDLLPAGHEWTPRLSHWAVVTLNLASRTCARHTVTKQFHQPYCPHLKGCDPFTDVSQLYFPMQQGVSMTIWGPGPSLSDAVTTDVGQ